MSTLSIRTCDGRTRFRPGQRVEGTVHWDLDEIPPGGLELRLFWYTAGIGRQDVGIIGTLPIPSPGRRGERAFDFTFPESPYSFNGKLVRIAWAFELVCMPKGMAERLEIVASPTGVEIDPALSPFGPSSATIPS